MTPDNDTNNSAYHKIIRTLRMFYGDIKKNIAIFSLTVIVITGGLLALNVMKANTYKASFTVVYEELVRKVYGDRLDKLDKILDNNPGKAQNLLNLDANQLKTLKSVHGTNILGENLSKDMNVDKIPFIVHMYLTDTAHTYAVQNAILNYLENSTEYLAEKRKLKFQEIESEIEYIDMQLDLMDSLKRKTNSSLSFQSKGEGATTENSSLYEVSYELYKKKQELMKKKTMPQNLYIIDDAIVSVKTSKSFVLVAIVGLILSFIVYGIIAYFVLPVIKK